MSHAASNNPVSSSRLTLTGMAYVLTGGVLVVAQAWMIHWILGTQSEHAPGWLYWLMLGALLSWHYAQLVFPMRGHGWILPWTLGLGAICSVAMVAVSDSASSVWLFIAGANLAVVAMHVLLRHKLQSTLPRWARHVWIGVALAPWPLGFVWIG